MTARHEQVRIEVDLDALSAQLPRILRAIELLGRYLRAGKTGPEPLCIDGHAYARRRRARRRRR